MSKKLLMVTGRKRNGKDTFGDYLVKNYGYIKTQPFACFKEPLAKIFGFTERQMNEDKEVVDERWGLSPRELFQEFGTGLMKTDLGERLPRYKETIGNNLWVKVFKEYFKNQPDGNYLVCDWRFPEEYEFIKDSFDITRIRIDSNRTKNNDKHISESGIDKLEVDYILNNNKTIKDFYKTIDNFIKLN